MSRLWRSAFVGLTAILGLVYLLPVARGDYSFEQAQADAKLFEDAKLPHTDAGLVEFFRKRLVNPQRQEAIDDLIKKLSSKSFKEREQAAAELIKEGPSALPALRKAANGTVALEFKKRCDKCIKAIETASPNTLVLAAARLLRARQTPGACALLLEYVAIAPDDIVEEEVCTSIYHLALVGAKVEVFPPQVKAGQLDPLLVKTLTDQEPARRAIAALVVGQFGTEAQRQQVQKLLADTSPQVRFRAAQTLVTAGDKNAVAVLVELLRSGPMDLALNAEDILSIAAGDQAPDVPLTEKVEARKKCHAAWQEWWTKHQGQIDLAKVAFDAPFAGLARRAKMGATQFLQALIKADKALLTKTSDVPFSLGGFIQFNTREEFNAFFDMLLQARELKDVSFKVGKVVGATEYMKTIPEQERNFLEAARPAQIHIVYVEIRDRGNMENITMYMRISGGRAKCIGVGVR
jgi:HEAT repeat protein